MTKFKLTISEELLKAAKQRAESQERTLTAHIRQLIKADLESAGEQQKELFSKSEKKAK